MNTPAADWMEHVQNLEQELKAVREAQSLAAERTYRLERANAALVAAMTRLANAADAVAADQTGASPKCGVVQPISAAEGTELCAAIEAAREAIRLAEVRP